MLYKGPPRRGPFSLLALLLALSLFSGCGSDSQAKGLKVFCAASLAGAVENTAKDEGIALSLNAGGSNALVRQVEQGATADLLLLADDREARKTLEPRGYRVLPLASNRLVVIAPVASALASGSFEPILRDAEELAVADASTAPLGSYTAEALQSLKLSAKVIPLKDSESVLSSVVLSHAGLGIVYRSDAQAEPEVKVVADVPADRHRPVLYVAVLPPSAPAESRRLVDSLLSGKGKAELSQRGFLAPP